MTFHRDGALWHLGDSRMSPIVESAAAVIGAYVDDNYKWSGRLADLRIWERPRTRDEIAADRGHRLTGKEPGLISYWPLSEVDADGSTPDLTGNRPGTVLGATIADDDSLPVAPAAHQPVTCVPVPEPVMAHMTVEPGPGPGPGPGPEPAPAPAPEAQAAPAAVPVNGQPAAVPRALRKRFCR